MNPAVTNVYAVEYHVINCNFSDIPSQIYGVKWSPHTIKTDGYTLKDGIFDQEKKFQVSTLTISSIELIELKGSAESHIFTCEITVGSNDRPVAASQTINIFNPSRGAVFPLFGHTFTFSQVVPSQSIVSNFCNEQQHAVWHQANLV